MKILLTGANGYIGKRLLPLLLAGGHEVFCCVRDKNRFHYQTSPAEPGQLNILEIDFLKPESAQNTAMDFDAAYYLIHSMTSTGNFQEMEKLASENFVSFAKASHIKQIIYLSGIINEKELSPHLNSRRNVEEILRNSGIALTVLRAGIIIGSGSASFEIMRDLVEKLPVMITPRWLRTKSQPISIRNVTEYLTGVLLNPITYNKHFDIVGPDILSYKQMLLGLAEMRGLKRYIFIVPLLTPRLSSYWLYFVTSVSYPLAVNLVESMTVEVIGRPNDLAGMLNIKLLSYRESLRLAFGKVEQDSVISSWKDAFNYNKNYFLINDHLNIPKFGCYSDKKELKITGDPERVMKNIWSIGGSRGWYYADFLWGIRGFLDKAFGGVGLRRGRTNNSELYPGDTLDFWRVLVADRHRMRLLLYAEMKLPGEAWLEFSITQKGNDYFLNQTATFRPRGLPGRLYWYSLLPWHYFIFNGMIRNIAGYNVQRPG
ncbi:MAG TPA: SDR family oxidoreductase [Ignavibacteriales bacterium]|nr:SDR family oxidoreductase [Ignavibacteriales bacterium]